MKLNIMKRTLLACLLSVSSHGHAVDLRPECYTLYDQYLAATDWAVVGHIADKMYDAQCWPALQNPDGSDSRQDLQPATNCNSLVPHVVKMINDQSHVNGYSILQTADAKVMTYETIDRVDGGHAIFTTISDNRGRSMQVRVPLQHDGKIYYPGKGYRIPATSAYDDDKGHQVMTSPAYYTYGNDGTVLVPNSDPFAASPLTGNTRVLDCSAEAQFTQGPYLIQMYLDRNSNGQEFIGMASLMEM